MVNPLIMGNWKMYTDCEGAISLAQNILQGLPSAVSRFPQIRVGICPPFPFLSAVQGVVQNTALLLGAQNLYPKEEGAFTGEVSPKMLRSLKCTHVILGHSERRSYFGETDEMVNQKITSALAFHLTPIVCVGETLEQRKSGKMKEIVTSQLTKSLEGLNKGLLSSLIVAYEPVWAIGTGMAASPQDAEEMHLHIREVLSSLSDSSAAKAITILYGGSVKGDNAKALGEQKNVDGALVGGASLKAPEFLKLIENFIAGKEKIS